MEAVDIIRNNDPELLSRLKEALGLELKCSEVMVDDQLVAALSEAIRPDLQSLDWMELAPYSESFCLLLEIAVKVFEHYSGDGLLLMALLGAYLNPRAPWSNREYSNIALAIDLSKCQALKQRFLDYLRPRVVISKEPQLRSVKSGSLKYVKTRALRPALGFTVYASSQDEERREWKASSNLLAISQVLLLLLMDGENQSTCGMCASFILQIFEDSDPLLKIQGLFLLEKLLDSNYHYLATSGLVQLYKEELKVCLTYLPQLTPTNVSMRLMKIAYPCFRRLVDLEVDAGLSPDSYTPYVEIIVSQLMGLISHILRSKDREINELLVFFLTEISRLIETRVLISILVCLSRLFFTLNQLITDPFIIDFDAGNSIVDAALQAQYTVLATFEKAADSEGLALVLAYKYDLLTGWAVLARRIKKFSVGTRESLCLIRLNLELLSKLSNEVPNEMAEFEKDKAQMLAEVPEMEDFFVM